MKQFANKDDSEILLKKPIYVDKYGYEGTLEKAINIARHYGFFLIEPIKELQKVGTLKNYLTPNEKKVVFKKLTNSEDIQNSKRHHVKSLMICHRKVNEFHLNIFDEKKSIAEATMIKTLSSILNDYGYKDTIVIINSLGDKLSKNNFIKDLKSYYRKNSNLICSNCKNKLTKDTFKLLECDSKKCIEAKENIPKSISYLEESERQHFKQIIEYLESVSMPYIIDNNLIGDINGGSHTIFQICEIVSDGDVINRRVLAKGERCFDFTEKDRLKKTTSLHSSISIDFNKNKYNKKEKYIILNSVPKKRIPKLYFVQLGHAARRAGLDIMENLRKNNINVYQSLAENGITTQISEANFLGVPFIIIMGNKEVNEQTIIVREMSTYQQSTIELKRLSEYIKRVVK